MTLDELNEGIERAEGWFRTMPGITDELVEAFITEGFLSFDDLTFLEPAEMAELGGIDEDLAADLIAYAEEAAERLEEESQHAPPPTEHETAGRAVASHLAVPAEEPPAADGEAHPAEHPMAEGDGATAAERAAVEMVVLEADGARAWRTAGG